MTTIKPQAAALRARKVKSTLHGNPQSTIVPALIFTSATVVLESRFTRADSSTGEIAANVRMRAAQSTPRRLAFLVPILWVMAAFGCTLGPHAMQLERQRYNETLARTNREELLLNLVRLRYADTIGLLEVGSIASQRSWDYSLTASGDVGQDAKNLLGLVGRFAWAERPTVSYTTPGQEAVRGILTPLTTEALFVLTYTGSPTEQLMRIVVKSINTVPNAIGVGGPTPREAPEFEEFARLIEILEGLARRRHVEVGRVERLTPVSGPVPTDSLGTGDYKSAHEDGYVYVPTGDGQSVVLNKKEQVTVLRIAHEAVDSPEVGELVQMLDLKPGLPEYEMRLALEGQLLTEPRPHQGRTEIMIGIRSLLETFFYLSQGIEVPESHVKKGIVTVTEDSTGRPFDWQQVLGGRFRVQVSKLRPSCAAVSVRYRGHWFYIDDRDEASKITFLELFKISALQTVGGGVEALPVLTLPVGG